MHDLPVMVRCPPQKTESFIYASLFSYSLFSGESQKMKKGDNGKKVLDVIVVPLILNSLSRRFKGESKGK